MTNETQWTPWAGGECPVTPGTPIKICTRAGQINIALAGLFIWKWWGEGTDIIGWSRQIPTTEEAL